jgi:hypothetical protein
VDSYGNLAYGVVTVAPSPASSGLSMTVSGSHWPAVPFNATVRPAGASEASISTAAEIVRVTANAAGVFTIVRASEGPNAARAIVVGDVVSAGLTAKTLDDILAGGPFTGLDVDPAAASLNTGLVVHQTASGVYDGNPSFNYDLNGIYIDSDDIDTQDHGIYGFHIHHDFGGAAATGQRLTLMSWLHQTTETDPTGADNLRYYIPVQATMQTDSGDGGTDTGAGSKGYYFGQNNVLLIDAANCSQLCGAEFDINASATSTSRYVMGLSICSGHVNRGADIDAAIDVHSVGASGGGGGPSYGPGGGFRHGFCLVSLGGLVPVSSDGTVVGSYIQSGFGVSTIPAAYGVDLNQFTFSQYAFRSPGFAVDPDGDIGFHGTLTAPGTITLSPGGTPFAALDTNGTLYLPGALGDTANRCAKAWLTDLEVTNAPTRGGVAIPSISSTNTLTNKRVTPRVGTVASSATPTINTDNVDVFTITALAAAITSMTTNLSGTPTDGQKLWIAITGTATRAITWGASFEASTVALPTTTSGTNRLDVGFVWNAVTSKWRCVAVA